MPTTNTKYIWYLIRTGKAKILRHKPMEVMLLKEVKEVNTNGKLTLGMDLGGTHSSVSVTLIKDTNASTNEVNVSVLYSDELEMRNKFVANGLRERATHRTERHKNRRGKRIRRAKKNKTVFSNGKNVLFGTAKATRTVKYIKNQKVRFNNRKPKRYIIKEGNLIVSKDKEAVFLSPTIRHLIETELSHFRKVYRLLPISDVVVEYTKFDIHKMINPDIKGEGYQNGTMKGFDSDFDYISEIQEGKCLFCDKSISDIHHRVARCENGSNRIVNKVGLCKEHHELVHKDKSLYKKLVKKLKNYQQTSWINIATPFILEGINQIIAKDNIKLSVTYGNVTYNCRAKLNLSKHHYTDSIAISLNNVKDKPINISNIKDISMFILNIKQYRTHNNRSNIYAVTDRKYTASIEYQVNDIKGRKTKKRELILVNRNKKMEQEEDSLSDFRRKLKTVADIKSIGKIMKSLVVVKGTKRYSSEKTFNPGDIIKHKNKTYVVQGNITGGKYLRLYNQDKTNFPAKECVLVKSVSNFVYL